MEGKGTVPESVKRCVATLKAVKNDNDRFASLFLVTKLIKAQECNDVCLKMIYDAIGFDFLNRLLRASEVPEDCPPFLYKSIALSIVSSFCGVPDIVNSNHVIGIIPVLLDIIGTSDTEDMEDNLMLVSDCYTCLQAIAGSSGGRKALLNKGASEKLAEIYVEEMFRHDEALKLLVQLASLEGSKVWNGNAECYLKLMRRLTNDFVGESNEKKFEMCRMLATLLSNSPDVQTQVLLSEDWPKDLLLTLEEILSSKLATVHRDDSLKLIARLLELSGIEWGLKLGPNPRQFLLLLVNLACIEIRMKLEDRTLNEVLQCADVLVACYTIVELFISFMASQGFLDFDQKQREQVYCALKGAVQGILGLLQQLAQDSQGSVWKSNDHRTNFACASIRILGSWLSEETSSMKSEVCALLPFVISVCRALYEERKQGNNEMPDPLRFMLPAFCHLGAEDEARKVLINEKIHELLYDYLQHHWEIFSKWLSEQPALAADWLHNETEEESMVEKCRCDSEAAIILICGIYMNVVVLESKLASEHAVFSQLLKFAIMHVPQLASRQDLVILHGNVAVLGLLILRHHAWKFRSGDSTVFRFIQGTVSFLWDAHNSEESCDSLSLVISLRYKKDWPDLAELWFLGMQSLSNLLDKLEWIVDFIIDSGWPQEIMKTLGKVIPGAIDANTRTAYEDFLCCLVKAQPNAKAIIKEHGGRHTCRTHSMKELLSLLDTKI